MIIKNIKTSTKSNKERVINNKHYIINNTEQTKKGKQLMKNIRGKYQQTINRVEIRHQTSNKKHTKNQKIQEITNKKIVYHPKLSNRIPCVIYLKYT